MAEIARQILSGLASVHAAGVLHRDVKPSNVVLARDANGSVSAKLVDFGLAKPVDAAQGSSLRATRPGVVMGTPEYMSPEQVRSGALDARTDLFSLGTVMYEAASGALPFDGVLASEMMASILSGHRTPLEARAPGIDVGLAAIIEKALAHRPDDRYASAFEMRAALSSWQSARSSERSALSARVDDP